MKRHFPIFLLLFFATVVQQLSAQRGYSEAPYKRYEADQAMLSDGAVATVKSYAQPDLQSEASDQVCVEMKTTNATAVFSLVEPADGLVIRFSVPDGDSAVIGIYSGETKLTSLNLTSKWSWEYLWSNGDPNNVGITNKNPRMRFDEVRYKLPEKVTSLKIVRESGNLSLDFIEMEPVQPEISAPAGAAIYTGNGSNLQSFIDANGGKTIYLPAGVYNINSQLYFGVADTKIQGAGMWYSQLNFTVTNASNGGLRANATGIGYADLYITSDMKTRTNGYAGIHGVYTQKSVIRNVWVEHCATGAWIAQYVQSGPANADGFLITNCRFRNTYADGINLCKGTVNAIVEHCNFRNNGDDGMAIWCAENMECINNTFRHNTAENGWRAAGIALYGGRDNKFYDILIKDNIDVGITVTNTFPGAGFNAEGQHDFHDITLKGCGTFNAIYNDRVGAVNIFHANQAGTKVRNIRMYNIDITDAKCDAIRIAKSSGDGIFNLIFENVTVNGTGKEYPSNNANGYTVARGFAVFFDKFPAGNGTYCSLNASNLGGNANGVLFSTTQKGSFSWTERTGCENVSVTGVGITPADTSIAGGKTIQLLPLFTPANATNKIVTFSSSDPKIASVTYNGLVTGRAIGEAIITATTLDGNYTATAKVEVTSNPVVYYKIKNRWQSTYLYDGGDRVKYGLSAANNTFLWNIEDNQGVKRLKNISTGDFMHIENLSGYVQCTPVATESKASEWIFEDAGNDFVRIKSNWHTESYIHIENLQNHGQYGPVENAWWSAMWHFEPVYISTKINELTVKSEEKIFPNPSTGDFTISINEKEISGEIFVSIYNLAGQLMYRALCPNEGQDNLKIATGNLLLPGNYLVVLKSKSAVLHTKLSIVRQ